MLRSAGGRGRGHGRPDAYRRWRDLDEREVKRIVEGVKAGRQP